MKDIVTNKEIIPDNSILVMFSGGFDSVAIVHKLICQEESHTSIICLYEVCNQFDDRDYGRQEVINVFTKLKEFAQTKDISLYLSFVELNTSFTLYHGDALLFLHLTTIMQHAYLATSNRIYLGWNLEDYLKGFYPLSSGLLDMFKEKLMTGSKIYFLNEFFGDSMQSKGRVVSYLLETNLFGYCWSHTPGFEIQLDAWFDTQDDKGVELFKGVLDTKLFTQKQLVAILKFSSLRQVQNYYNKRVKEVKCKEIAEELVVPGDKEVDILKVEDKKEE